MRRAPVALAPFACAPIVPAEGDFDDAIAVLCQILRDEPGLTLADNKSWTATVAYERGNGCRNGLDRERSTRGGAVDLAT